MKDVLAHQFEAYKAKFGREPGPDDKIFWMSPFPPESRTGLSARGHPGSDLKWSRKSCHRHLELVCI